MDNIFGKSQVETTSGLIHNRTLRFTLEALLLMGLGALAVLLHARLRSHISVPGHHGIEFMALLMLGRLSSNLKFASTLSSFGIGLLLLFPVFGFNDPMMGLNMMLPGFLLDFSYHFGGQFSRKAWFVMLIAGFSYLLIPVSRLIFSAFTGYQYGAFLKFGPIIPVVSHFTFGLMGGMFGTGLSKIINKLFSKLLH